MIRPDLMKAVLVALESHRYLAPEDFAVTEYSNREGNPCLAVQYRYDKNLSFKFSIPTQKTRKSRDESGETYRFHCTMRPGREAVEEALFADERDGLLSELKQWMGRLYDDVVSAPAIRQFQDHAAAINELTERLNELPDEPLSRADVQAFSDGLEKVKADLTEELKQHSKDKDELKNQVQELTRDIDFLKKTLESMTKRQWGELFTSRVHRWKSRFSLRQLAAGARVAKLLLPSEAGAVLESVAQVIDGVANVVPEKTPDSENK